MNRSAIRAAATLLFCVSIPCIASAQREVPRNTILKRPSTEPASKTAVDTAGEAAASKAMAPGTGSIMGTVLDSLSGTMLDAATVTVLGPQPRSATTNMSGVFRIDSVPPGRHLLELKHPVLDSIGIRVVSDTVSVTDGHVATIELAVPGARTVMTAVCSPAKLLFGPGAIMGRVIDAGTNGAATGAEVSVAWTETVANMTEGVHTTPRLRTATVAADGTYHICGVPTEFSGTLQAIRGAAKTAEVPIDVADQRLSLRVLYLPPVAVASDGGNRGPKIPRAVIVGTVTNAGGVPVAGARVSVQGGSASTSTGSDGKFTLTGVLPGTQAVLVRSVGFSPVETPLDVITQRTNHLTVRLGKYTARLATVDVKAAADPLESVGFERRRKMGFGRFLNWDEIKNMNPTYASDILRAMPGIFISGSGSSATITSTRSNGCVTVLVDNTQVDVASGQTIDEVLNPQDIVSAEFYDPISVPMELGGGRNHGCALLAIWTRAKADMSKLSRRSGSGPGR